MIAVALTILMSCSYLGAQDTAPTQAGRTIGTVSAVNGNVVTLKTDNGTESSVTVQDSTRILQTAPGQKDLKQATPIHVQDVQVGDRILVRGAPSSDGKSVAASTLVVMKQGDLAQKQEQETQQWQRGSGGIVRSIDPGGAIVVSIAPNHTLTIRTSNNTQFLRYAPGSVKFTDAVRGSLDEIRPGDQLRARGTRNPDASELTADAVISGSFRNIAGLVTTLDSGANTVTVNDLATRKPVTVKITSDTQMRKLPAPMAQRIAMYVKGTPPGAAAAGQQPGGQPSAPSGGGVGERRFGAAGGPNAGSGGSPDFQQMIRRMPAATISDLQKGDAVMIVTTAGEGDAGITALTLIGGVEPILTAAPTQSNTAASLLSGWSLSGGAPDAQ
jgi:hypothetical protein